MPSDSKFTRDDDGNVAVRVVSNTGVSEQPESMFTTDEDGNVAVRVVFGEGGGGGSDQHNLGWYATQAALEEAYPTANAGDWAIVGATDTVWIWDTDTSTWKDSDQKGQVTSVNNQTGAVTITADDILPTQTGYSGRVLGTDGFVAGWVKPEIVQRDTMPQASEDEVGNIYQFTGTTTSSYTNGYFYKCVSDGGNPATYSWSQVSVQPAPSGLPDQTGQSGKFLTTNGTDASWSDKPLQNTATGINSLTIAGNTQTWNQTINIGGGTSVGGFNVSGTTTIGSQATGYGSSSTNVGAFSKTGSNQATAYGASAEATAFQSMALGYLAKATAQSAIQINASISSHTNSDANTFKVANANGNYEIMSADGTIPADRLTKAINKYSTMPTAESTNEGWIVQFTGTTDSTYTHGHLYECVSDGQDPATYSWTEVSMGGGSALPDQTGQSGKFLTTDGTDASWGNALVNKAASTTGALNIEGGYSSGFYATAQEATNVGVWSRATQKHATAYGCSSDVRGYNGIAIGADAYVHNNMAGGIAIGAHAQVDATQAIQISAVADDVYLTNSESKTVCIGFGTNENYKVLDSDGTIPTARLTKVNSTITLTAAGWSSNTQTVNVTGMTADGVVFPCPIPADQADYTSAGILCTAQAAGTLTFTCDTVPSGDIDVNVVML